VLATVKTMLSPLGAKRLTAPGKLQSFAAAVQALSAALPEVLSTTQVAARALVAASSKTKTDKICARWRVEKAFMRAPRIIGQK